MSAPVRDYAELIERLEKATGPDRDLDAQIYCAKNGYGFIKFERWNQHAGRLFYSIPGMTPHCESEGFPLYTFSIDAAVTLVSEGAEIEIHNLYGVAVAKVGLNFSDGPLCGERMDGALAIALCIASLKALAALPAPTPRSSMGGAK